MKILKWILSSIPAAVLALGGIAVAKADTNTNDLPHFQEMLRVLRANLAGVTDDELNQAAVNGLLNQLYPRVMLVTNAAPATDSPGRVSRSALYDKVYGYIRVPEVGKGLAEQIASAYAGLTQTNQLKGLVLDLRFAGGVDYESAAKTVDLFLSKERPLLDWQDGSARSTAKSNAIKVPLAVLVNGQTTAAAEALAAVLRETEVALIVGAPTAGGAHAFKEVALSNGRKLRIASGSVTTGGGTKLTAEGVSPDIMVAVNSEDETLYFLDPFALPAGVTSRSRGGGSAQDSSTTRQTRRRVNEAELVRLQREGQEARDPAAAASSPAPGATRSTEENAEPVIRDPALARALDLLKGITIIGQARQP